ncbi:MAG: hypothetical protein D6824_03530 [Planctomycetota bacterium]|nr:MAG: hypothetical protein D6824_03530 [Planctomycetota bacterium]
MGVTSKLLRYHRVESNLRSLRSRITAQERYLRQQDAQLKQLDERRDALESQIRQVEAAIHNDETEIASLDEKINHTRQTLNTVTTSKQYTALLTELNTFKADKSEIEERVLERMGTLEALRKQLDELQSQRDERMKIRQAALEELERRKADAASRLEELERELAVAASDVPEDILRLYQQEVERRGDEEVMAPLEEHDRKRMEYACGACQVLMPVEVISTLLGSGDVTRCVSCGVLLYVQEETREALSSRK